MKMEKARDFNVYHMFSNTRQDFLQDFPFWGGGELKDLGGSSLGPLGVKNKVSKNVGGE